MTLTKRFFPMLLVGVAALTITAFAGSTLATLGAMIKHSLNSATQQASGLQAARR